MVKGPGLDKLDMELPPGMPWKPLFGRIWNNENRERDFKMTYGGMYQKTGDLRWMGLDARLACGHRFHEKLGPKIEIIGMGKKTYSDVVGIVEELIEGDAMESAMLRVDLTADTEGIPVSEFERALYLRNMQTSQTEYGDPVNDVIVRAYQRGKGETIYFNTRNGQVRIYNKTEHRRKLLIALNNKRRRHNEPMTTFEEEYGYDPKEIRTRVEKQCGARLAEKLWGIRTLGEIHRLADVKPFYNFKFARDAKRGEDFDQLGPSMALLMDLLRDFATDHSLVETRHKIRQRFDNPRSYRKFIQEYESHFTPKTQLTREMLTDQYRRSIIAQLAA